jgi:hypothetical protein
LCFALKTSYVLGWRLKAYYVLCYRLSPEALVAKGFSDVLVLKVDK